jgi:hypothetical protein
MINLTVTRLGCTHCQWMYRGSFYTDLHWPCQCSAWLHLGTVVPLDSESGLRLGVLHSESQLPVNLRRAAGQSLPVAANVNF